MMWEAHRFLLFCVSNSKVAGGGVHALASGLESCFRRPWSRRRGRNVLISYVNSARGCSAGRFCL